MKQFTSHFYPNQRLKFTSMIVRCQLFGFLQFWFQLGAGIEFNLSFQIRLSAIAVWLGSSEIILNFYPEPSANAEIQTGTKFTSMKLISTFWKTVELSWNIMRSNTTNLFSDIETRRAGLHQYNISINDLVFVVSKDNFRPQSPQICGELKKNIHKSLEKFTSSEKFTNLKNKLDRRFRNAASTKRHIYLQIVAIVHHRWRCSQPPMPRKRFRDSISPFHSGKQSK